MASNRLPIELRKDGDGRWLVEPGSGGLVTALEPVLARRGGTWVGWPGVLEEDGPDAERVVHRESGSAYDVVPVTLTARERRGFYYGFSNQILWPLCHGLLDRCNFEPRFWDVYRTVNRKFARAIRRASTGSRLIWAHDYHLMAVAEDLRRQGCASPLAFFLHIPFPPPEIFEQLPWAGEVLESLLRFDLVGLQGERDRRNFLACVEHLGPGDAVVGDGGVRVPSTGVRTGVGVFPISIDYRAFHEGAKDDAVAEEAACLREQIGVERILLGVDRLDYTKGLPRKLKALAHALERYPELRGRTTLVQLVVPSRERIPEYHCLKREIEQLVGRINGRFTDGGWSPILYQFGTWTQRRLLSFYRAADAVLVTPLRDGMNLVSKEFCAASVDGKGVLVLSRFAGAAAELGDGALLVNPNDVQAVAHAILRACTMPARERRHRLDRLQAHVRRHDVHRWVARFLDAVEVAWGRVPIASQPGTIRRSAGRRRRSASRRDRRAAPPHPPSSR